MTSAVSKLSRTLGRGVARRYRSARLRVSLGWSRVREYLLAVAGAGCLAGAGFTISITVGLVVSGLALFFIEWRVDEK